MQKTENLKGVPRPAMFMSGFDPLQNVGIECAHKLEEAEYAAAVSCRLPGVRTQGD